METNSRKSGVYFIMQFLKVVLNSHDVPHPPEMHMYTITITFVHKYTTRK